jgi:chitodextrinase
MKFRPPMFRRLIRAYGIAQLGLVVLSHQAFASGALVQTASILTDTASTTIAKAFTSANTSGNLIAVVASWGTHNTTPTVTDSLGNTYVLATTSYSSAGVQSLAIFYAKSIKAGANTVTVHFGTSDSWRRLLIAEYSGLSPTSPVDVITSSQGNATTGANSATSGSGTTTATNDLIFGAVENFDVAGTLSAGTGFTLRNSVNDSNVIETAIEDKILASPGSASATFTFAHADPYIAEMVAFKSTTTATDTTPPSVPTGLSATAISSSQINLSWTASTDNVGVAGYQIFRNGTEIATEATTSYTDTGLTAATTYSYTLAAFDAAGNISGQSAAASATTAAATTAPSIASFTASPTSIVSGNSSTLSWSVSGNPTPTLSISGVGTVTGTSVAVSPTATTTYTLTATSSAGSATAQVTVTVTPATVAPTIASFTASPTSIVSGNTSTLSWSASGNPTPTLSINNGVGTVIGTSVAVSPTATTTYTLTATNSAGNKTAQVTVTVTPATVAPTIVSFTASPTSIVSGKSSTLSWSVSGNPTPTLSINNGVGTVSGTSVSVSPTATTTYTITATSSAGTATAQLTVTVTAATAGPSVPTGLTATATSTSQISLSWTVSTDNAGATITGYHLFRNGTQSATAGTWPAYTITGLTPSTTYTFTVAAVDSAGNVSGQSASAIATTQGPTAAPTIASLTASPATISSGSSSTLAWTVSGNPTPTLSISGIGTVTGTSVSVSPTASTTYTLTATNSSGSATAQATVSVTPSSDNTPPSVPAGLSATAVAPFQVDLLWTASTDNTGVTGYQIFRSGNQIGTSASASYVDTGLSPSTTYVYNVAAYDAAGNVSAQSASATVTTPAQPSTAYPIKISASGTYLVDQNNQPFFIVGDAPQLLFVQISNADVETYLSDRASRGFNSLWVYPVDNADQANAPQDFYGEKPFDGADFTNEDPVYWTHIDYLIQQMASYGMTAWMEPGFVGLTAANGYLTSYENSSDAVVTAYGAWLGSRYKNFPNIVWTLGGDADPANTAVYQKLSDLANGIRSTDSVHLITFEASRFTNGQAVPSGGYSSLDAWPSSPSWLNLNWVYQTGATVVSGAQSNYSRSPWLPPLMGEDWYELTETAFGVRQEGYEEILGGTYLGRLFGNDVIWDFNSPVYAQSGDPTWQSQLGSPGSIAQAYMGALFRSREHWKLVPDINNTVLTAGFQSGSTLALAARTSDGQTVVAYIPAGQTITISLAKISDTSAQAWWFNPQTAATTLIGSFPTTGSQSFTPPDQNDWVLVIDAASAKLPAPGTNVYGQ